MISFPSENVFNARNLGEKKETVQTLVAVHCDENGQWNEPATVRIYMGRSRYASRTYCSIWLRTRDGLHCDGHGWAGGYGYHRPSAAMQAALDSAGISGLNPIDGRGGSAMRDALAAILAAAGWVNFHIVEC